MKCELIRIEPQPQRGKPFQIAGCLSVDGQDPAAFWFNERIGWPHSNKTVFQWRCPLGPEGEPVNVDGVWYWRRKQSPFNRPLPVQPQEWCEETGG